MDEQVAIDLITAKELSKASGGDNPLFLTLATHYREGELFIPIDQPLPDSPYIVQKDGKLYFEAAYRVTQELSLLYNKFMEMKPHLLVDEAELLSANLLPEQAAAIRQALTCCLSCIWGGPGTGKTYTAGWLVKLFLAQHPTARVALAAPTGKAAANLLASIERACGVTNLESKTIHALLGVRQKQQRRDLLPYDLLIIDESSMIDASLCVKLLSAVADGARIVFLGDPNQLPPIEPGEPFVSFVTPQGRLTTVKRQENNDIIDLARYVLEGNADAALSYIDLRSDFSPESYVKQFYTPQTVEEFFILLSQTRLLCPQRYGCERINRQMKEDSPTHLEPIIITKNDYALGLTNGQVGILSYDTAYFDGIAIPKILLSSYETAYCLSVHKSQGSEFGEVVLYLPEGSESFGRKMLYTAITRAKKKLIIYGTEATVRACIANPGRPCTTFFNK
ncbi:MAG: AAA family ATPase [Verrucomicrobia bacterium]|nr:AAA family ATPase [Verrucomicrobiota bacterium]MBS0636897.1 AAA family ATPase [Verrucomicrobiota bacterium]